MYGMMFKVKIDILPRAPPVKVLNIPIIPRPWSLIKLSKTLKFIPGRDIYVPTLYIISINKTKKILFPKSVLMLEALLKF